MFYVKRYSSHGIQLVLIRFDVTRLFSFSVGSTQGTCNRFVIFTTANRHPFRLLSLYAPRLRVGVSHLPCRPIHQYLLTLFVHICFPSVFVVITLLALLCGFPFVVHFCERLLQINPSISRNCWALQTPRRLCWTGLSRSSIWHQPEAPDDVNTVPT